MAAKRLPLFPVDENVLPTPSTERSPILFPADQIVLDDIPFASRMPTPPLLLGCWAAIAKRTRRYLRFRISPVQIRSGISVARENSPRSSHSSNHVLRNQRASRRFPVDFHPPFCGNQNFSYNRTHRRFKASITTSALCPVPFPVPSALESFLLLASPSF